MYASKSSGIWDSGILASASNAVATALFKEYRGYLYQLATGLVSRKASTDVDDLVQVGWIGLIEAHYKYDGDKGAAFWTFAFYRVRGSMIDTIRNALYFSRGVGANYELEQYDIETHGLSDYDHNLWQLSWANLVEDLQDRERQILTLHVIRGLALHRIGILYGVSESRIAQIVQQARKKIRSKLQ